MTEELSIQGALAETTVPDLFRSLIRSGETAVVTLDALGRNDVIFFNEGRIINASSSDPDIGVAEVLLRSGELDLQKYAQAMDRLVAGRQIGALLVEMGYLRPDELIRAVERQASAIVVNAMAYRTGSYTIEFTSEIGDGVTRLPLSTERLILDGIRHVDHWSLISRGVGRIDRVLELVPGAATRSYALELDDDESHILSLFSEPQTIRNVCERSYLSNFLTCRTVWGLMVVNLLHDAEEAVVADKRAEVESQYEVEGLVERYNEVFQGLFALVFQKVGDHVYDFMDRVFLHLNHETVPFLSGMNLVNEARVDYEQLFNNLVAASVEDQKAVIEQILNELLYGWLFEIRNEFGGDTEAEAQKLAEGLRRVEWGDVEGPGDEDQAGS